MLNNPIESDTKHESANFKIIKNLNELKSLAEVKYQRKNIESIIADNYKQNIKDDSLIEELDKYIFR